MGRLLHHLLQATLNRSEERLLNRTFACICRWGSRPTHGPSLCCATVRLLAFTSSAPTHGTFLQNGGSPVRVLRVVRGSATTAVDVGGRAATGGAGGKQQAPQQPASPGRSAAVASLAHRAGVHSIEALLRLLSPRSLAEVEASLAAMPQGQQQGQRAGKQRGRVTAAQQRAQSGAGAEGGEPPAALLLPLPASLL